MSHIFCKGYPDGNPFDALTASTLDVGHIDFDLSHTATTQEGRLTWDDDSGTLELGMPGGEVCLQIGQELIVRVYNDTGVLIPNGTIVKQIGSHGNRPSITGVSASEATIPGSIAMATEDIGDGDFGYCTFIGLVHGLNTSSWAEGTQLYLSTTAGEITDVYPMAPNHRMWVAVVNSSHVTDGSVYFRPGPAVRLSCLADVNGTTPDDTNKHLVWDNINKYWDADQIEHADLTGLAEATAHTQYLLNNADDTTTGRLTADGGFQSDHSIAPIGSEQIEKICVDSDVLYTGFFTTGSKLNNYCNNISITADTGSFLAATETIVGYDNILNLHDAGSVANLASVYAIRSIVDANSTFKFNNPALSFEFKNPDPDQDWDTGFFNITVNGADAKRTIACRTVAQVESGFTSVAYGYQGYAVGAGGPGASGGTIIGVAGIAWDSAKHDVMVGVDGTVMGSSFTPASLKMGVRSVGHMLVKNGSCIIGSENTPSAITTTHLDFLNNTGEFYVKNDVEVDGELFCDGNETSSVTAVTANYTATNKTNIYANASGGTITITLPTGTLGRKFEITKTDSSSNAVTIGGTVNGMTNPTIPFQYDSVSLQYNGSEWSIR